MPLELWAAFVAASSILLLIPGPTVLLALGDFTGLLIGAGVATVTMSGART